MKQNFTAHVWQEDNSYIAQCLEVDVASQGDTETEALTHLGEALSLHFTPPLASRLPTLRPVEAAEATG